MKMLAKHEREGCSKSGNGREWGSRAKDRPDFHFRRGGGGGGGQRTRPTYSTVPPPRTGRTWPDIWWPKRHLQPLSYLVRLSFTSFVVCSLQDQFLATLLQLLNYIYDNHVGKAFYFLNSLITYTVFNIIVLIHHCVYLPTCSVRHIGCRLGRMNRTMNEYEVCLCHKFKWFIGGADQASNMLHRQFLAPILYTHPTSLAAVGYTYSWMIVTQGDYENMVVGPDDPAGFSGHLSSSLFN